MECKEQRDRVRESNEANRIVMPPDVEQKIHRAFEQLATHAAVCFWCGHGYPEFNAKAEAEHFAHHCPDAQEELKENASRRLGVALPRRPQLMRTVCISDTHELHREVTVPGWRPSHPCRGLHLLLEAPIHGLRLR
jgi:hypothetical protein